MTTDAIIQGTALPTDLYIPPDALQVVIESFEGPLDLLLYLIQRQNLDILNIPIADITQQYLQYVELMKEMELDLASEYLLMAAVLMEIKSRLLLPTSNDDEVKDADPRAKLIQQLREYAQYKQAAQDLDELPQMGRDLLPVFVAQHDIPKEIIIPNITLSNLLEAMREVMERTTLFNSHYVTRDALSVRERMSLILDCLKKSPRIDFVKLFTLEEGRAGVVVTFIAILELTKESLIQIIQTFETIQVISVE